ncbi:MAG: rRNA maturation RNase YbeY [Marinilabiliaceae bacterium]|nr:rRNA maturation RNase YbeY [Marinilabiliaceae bacterium]
MQILFDSINTTLPAINQKELSKWISDAVISNGKKIKELSIIFCDDQYILQLNEKYLDHSYYTDILTFDYSEKNFISGDLIISIDTVLSNSKQFKTQFLTELHRVIIHGILHLLGFDDKTEEQKQIIRDKEEYYLERLNNI